MANAMGCVRVVPGWCGKRLVSPRTRSPDWNPDVALAPQPVVLLPVTHVPLRQDTPIECARFAALCMGATAAPDGSAVRRPKAREGSAHPWSGMRVATPQPRETPSHSDG